MPRDADLRDADLSRVDLSDANLSQADLQSALLLDTKVHRTKFTGARVYGISAWNLDFENTEQSNLVLTPRGEPMITVDSLEVAQFVYLLVKNPKIRNIINTVGQKSVLILGSFGERMEVLDAIRAAVREHDLLPIVFDFERPEDRDLTETIMTLAGMSRFIVADISSPRSVPFRTGRSRHLFGISGALWSIAPMKSCSFSEKRKPPHWSLRTLTTSEACSSPQ